MKRQLTVALGLAVLATPAFATKARLQALGEDIYGSFYINDNRNVWLNPAQVNNHKDMVTYELGGNVGVDSAETPRGEGGVYKSIGNLVYGLHFGSASNSANQLRASGGLINIEDGAADGTGNEANNIDLFVGGDAGLKWGANLGYARATDGAGTRSESLRTRLGVIMGDTQVYTNINLINNARGSFSTDDPGDFEGTAKFEGKLGFQVGAIHAWEGNSITVDYRQFSAESTLNSDIPASSTSAEDQQIKQLQVGIGRVTRLNDKTNLFTRASFVWIDAENDGVIAGDFSGTCSASPFFCAEYKSMRVPVVIGVETEATSWLTLRASVSQAVWGSEEDEDNERTLLNNTAINAGATLKFGELSVDGVIGNGTAANGIGENTAAGNGTLRTDTLMTRVGVNYRF